MHIDGIMASEAIDSSGEIFDVEGSDISDLEEGRGLANWEHRGDDAPGASGLDIVGKIVYARKIMKRSDCEDDRQRMYWDKVKLPFVYGIIRLYDGAGHQSAIALAAMIRDHVANDENILVRFSIEGSTLEKEGNRLKRTVARRVALTVKPCNRTCDSGLITDPNAPAGFSKQPEAEAKDILANLTEKHEHPLFTRLGGSVEVETSPELSLELRAAIKDRLKKALQEKMAKTSTAGMPTGAPGTLVGGAALQREHLDKRTVTNTVKAALRDYKPKEHGDFKTFLKAKLPDASEEFLSHFEQIADDYQAKLKKAEAQNEIETYRIGAQKGVSGTFFGDRIQEWPGQRNPRWSRKLPLSGPGVAVFQSPTSSGDASEAPLAQAVHSGTIEVPAEHRQLLSSGPFSWKDISVGDAVGALALKQKGIDIAHFTHPEGKGTVSVDLRDHSVPELQAAVESAKGMKKADTSFDWSPGGFKQTKHGDSTIVHSYDGNQAHLISIRTPQSKRGKGSATAAMNAFLKEADSLGIPVKLEASPLDKKTDRSKLVNFYSKMGFGLTGKVINPAGDPEMIRHPSVKKAQGKDPVVKPDEEPAPKSEPEKKIKATPGFTFRGEALSENADVPKGSLTFDENSGELKTPKGTFKMYNPDDDGALASESFKYIWHSPEVRDHHDYAIRNWLRVHKALKEGTLPQAVIATSVAFSQLSPNTPVPVHEMMYAYLLDTMKRKGIDPRDPKFGDGFKFEPVPGQKKWELKGKGPVFSDWVGRDTPQGWPDSSKDYFTDKIPDLVTIGNDSATSGRKAGDRAGFMMPAGKFRNIAEYHKLHNAMVDLVARHGVDARSAVKELMDGKIEGQKHDGKRARALESGKPDPGEFQGVAVPGLAPKTARFAYAMLGAGNSFVPDTHFTRHLFGLDKDKDTNSIDFLKEDVMWKENQSDLLGAMDRWYFNNHPAVKYMLNHPEFGKYFKDDPEQAIFPAFWGHWLSIPSHEATLGHQRANNASNQSASHRPIFDEIDRLLRDPKESKLTVPARSSPVAASQAAKGVVTYPIPRLKKAESAPEHGALIHPVHAAYLLRDWVDQLGETHALQKFYTHLIPLLMPAKNENEQLNVPALIRKFERLSVDLRKAAEDVATGNFKSPKTPASMSRQPSSVVDSRVHGDRDLNTRQEQHDLIHGMDVGKNFAAPEHAQGGVTTRAWVKTANGHLALMKKGNIHEDSLGMGEARREVAYHNLAHDFFGMGKFVPTTAMVRHPTTGAEWSVQEAVPGAEHVEFSPRVKKKSNGDEFHTMMLSDKHSKALQHHFDNGDLDKLWLMNTVLGNGDRHSGNYVFSDQGDQKIKMIDHSHAFKAWGYNPDIPAYIEHQNSNQWEKDHTSVHLDKPLHPDAGQWLMSLDPQKLGEHLKKNKVTPEATQASVKSLIEMQNQYGKNAAIDRDTLHNSHGNMLRDWHGKNGLKNANTEIMSSSPSPAPQSRKTV